MNNITTRICRNGCNDGKPLPLNDENFYRDKKMGKKHLSICRPCQRKKKNARLQAKRDEQKQFSIV